MKRFLILIGLVLSLSLTACSKKEESAPVETNEGTEETTTAELPRIAYIVGNLGDKSFSDSGEVGMNTLRSEGYDVVTIETNSQADKYNDYILDAIDQGYNYIVASSTYYDNCLELAKEYKDVKFIVFDDNKTSEELEDNMSVIFYAQNEGSYLVGMMAAGMSKSGTVAVDVGMENPVINDFVTGYVQGIKDYNAENKTAVKVVMAAVGSWSDPAKMKSLVLDQARNNGADVFYQVAGGSGDGLFEGAKESGAWAIGVDSDQYALYKDSENPEKADVILTSMLKEVGNSLVSIIHSAVNGEDIWKKTTVLGLAEDSVGYVDNDFFKANVSEELRNKMADAAAKIKAGELEVKSYFDFADEAEYKAFVAEAQ